MPFLASGALVLGQSIFVSQVKNKMARDICVTSCPPLRSPYPRCAVIPYMLIIFTGVDATSWNGGYMGCGPSLGAADWLGTLPTAKTSGCPVGANLGPPGTPWEMSHSGLHHSHCLHCRQSHLPQGPWLSTLREDFLKPATTHPRCRSNKQTQHSQWDENVRVQERSNVWNNLRE